MQQPLKRFARRRIRLLCVALLLSTGGTACGQMSMDELAKKVGVRIVAQGQSGKRLRRQNEKRIPWKGVAQRDRQQVSEVLDKCAQYRRLPELQYRVQPQMYRYLIDHPDVAVSTWRTMEISRLQLWESGPKTFKTTAPDGSTGTARVVYRDASQCLALCNGTYHSPLLPKPITASALIWLRYKLLKDRQGDIQVRQTLDVFVSFPSATARTVAALASPITNVIMDRNAFEVSLYARMMSQAAERDPKWLQDLAVRMEGVQPQRRHELASFARPVETRRDRTAAVSGRAI